MSINKNQIISYYARALYDGKTYISNLRCNGFYCIENGECNLLAFFENEKDDAIALHNSSIVIGNEIWFLPLFGKKLGVVDVSKKSISSYRLWPWENSGGTFACSGYIQKEDSIVLIPEDYLKDTIEINITTKKIRPTNLMCQLRKKIKSCNKEVSVCALNDYYTIIYFKGTNFFAQIDNDEIDANIYMTEGITIRCMCSYKNALFITTNKDLFVWDMNKKRLEKILEYGERFDEGDLIVMDSNSKYIFLLNASKDLLVCIDVENHIHNIKKIPYEVCDIGDDVSKWSHYWNLYSNDSGVVISPVSSCYEVIYYTQSNEMKINTFKMKDNINISGYIYEKSQQDCFKDFIDYIVSIE